MKLFGLNLFGSPKPDSSDRSALSAQPAKAVDPNAWLTGADVSETGEGAKLITPYGQSAWVYIAVSTLAQSVSQTPFRIARIPAAAKKRLAGFFETRAAGLRAKTAHIRLLNENLVDSGPVVDLFDRPHPSMDRALYWESVVTWQALRGEFFVLPMDDQDNPIDLATARTFSRITGQSSVRRIITLMPEMFWHVVEGYNLAGWRYTGSMLVSPIPSQMLLPSEVIHSRTPNPYLYWRGLSPITLAMLPASADYAAEQFQKGLMMNNADTGVIVTTEQQASKEQREAILSALRERKRKAGTPDRPLFLWGGAKLDKPAISSADMQFLENRKLNRQEICAIFGVPESLLGFTERGRSLGGGGEMEQDKLNFIESKIIPHCRRLEAAHDPIVKSFGDDLVGYFDVDDLPILQNARRTRLDAGEKAWSMGVPFNTVNETYDLGFPKIKGGDVGLVAFNLQPVEQVGEAQEPAPEDPNNPAPEPADNPDPNQNLFSRAERFLDRLVAPSSAPRATQHAPHVCSGSAAHDAALAPRIKQKKSKLSRFWFEQRGRILSKLPQLMKEFRFERNVVGSETKDGVSYPVYGKGGRWLWTPVEKTSRGIDDLFDQPSEDAKLLRAMKPGLISDLEYGGTSLYKEIGQDNFSLAPKDAIAFLDKRANAISGINQTTWDRLRSSLQDGLQNGEPMDDLVDRVKTFFAGQDGRAETIATTETNIAVNSGRFQAMKDAKVTRKGWQTSHLENTRSTHIANEELSNEENGIPIDEAWPNGCMYPGDPDGDPSETINCRCFGFAILDKED